MTRLRRLAPTRLGVGRLVMMLGCLAGLFLMHGLGDHGTAGQTTEPGHSMVAMSATPAAVVADHALPRAMDGHTVAPLPHHHAMDSMAMCVAVLVATLLLLIATMPLVVVLRRARDALARLVHAAVVPAPARPPDLTQLSVFRC